MTPETSAILTLGLYAAAAAAAVAWQTLRCASGPTVWWLYALERLFAGLLWRVRGASPTGRAARPPFPQDAPALIVANHRSPVDPIVLWQNSHLAGPDRIVRPISFLMAREFYEDRRLTWFYKAMRSIPVTRGGNDSAAVRQALGHLKAGDLVGIFPEGGINTGPPGLRPANPGVAFLALSTDAPVFPVYIDGTATGSSMVRAFFRPARIRLIYGDPIDLTPYRGRKKSQELLREVTDVIMNAVAALGGVPYAGTRLPEATKPPAAPPAAARDATDDEALRPDPTGVRPEGLSTRA